MKCNEFLEHLSQYVENDLSDEKKRECEEHLFSCEECRRAFEEEKEISRLFTEAMNDDEILFESRIDNVMASIDKTKYSNKKVVSLESKKRKRFINKKVAGLAAVCAVCLYFAPGVIQSGMYQSKDSAMAEKSYYSGTEVESDDIATIAAEEDKSNVAKVRSYGVEREDEEEKVINNQPIVTGMFTGDNKAEEDEAVGDGVVQNSTVNSDSVNEDKDEDVSETEENSDSMKDEVPSVKTATMSEKDKNIGKTAVENTTAVPGLHDKEEKLNEILEKDKYLMDNFGITVVHAEEGSYIDNNGKSETFGFKFATIENYAEDESFVYMIYRGNREKGGDITSKVLKFHKDTKKMEEIYEIKSPEIIDSLKIEEDGLVYIIKYKEKTKSMKINK